jgi:hypothetical protein
MWGTRHRYDSIGRRVDFEPRCLRVGLQLGKVGFDLPDPVRGPAGGGGDGQRLVAVRVEILPGLADRVAGCFGRFAAPTGEGGQGRQPVCGVERSLGAAVRGAEHFAHVAGVPPLDVSDGQRHEESTGRFAGYSAGGSGRDLECLAVALLHLAEGLSARVQTLGVVAEPREQGARRSQPRVAPSAQAAADIPCQPA